MSFLRGLFGGKSGAAAPKVKAADAVDYKGYKIQPAPQRQEGQWLTGGVISKEIDGEVKERSFLRADLFAAKEDADTCALAKARQIIDERGDKLFDAERV